MKIGRHKGTGRYLIREARRAAKNAYCPYSRFAVGAAILSSDGRVFSGANVENSSYGLTVCAERSAIVAAVSAGAREFLAIAVVGGGRQTSILPCGACLQFLSEFCGAKMPVFLAPLRGGAGRMTVLGKLLPSAFMFKKKGVVET